MQKRSRKLTPDGLPVITPEAFEAWREQAEDKYQEVCSKLASEQPMLCWIFEFEKKADDEASGLPWLVMFYHLFLLQAELDKKERESDGSEEEQATGQGTDK